MHFCTYCLKLLKVYCNCIICLITILKVFNKNKKNIFILGQSCTMSTATMVKLDPFIL